MSDSLSYDQKARVRQERIWNEIVEKELRHNRPFKRFQMNHTRPLPPVVTTVTDKVQHKTPQERILASKVDASSYEIQAMRHRSKVPAERLTAPETSQQEIGWLVGVRSLELKRNERSNKVYSKDCSRVPTVMQQQAADLPTDTVTNLNSLNPSRWRYSKSTCDVTQYVDECVITKTRNPKLDSLSLSDM